MIDEIDVMVMENEIISLISPHITKYLDVGYDFETIYKIIINALKKIKNEHDEDTKKRVDLSEEIIVIMDMFGSIVYANENAQKISGYTLEESIGKNISEMLDKEEIEKLYQRLTLRNLGEEQEFFYKSRFLSKDGTIIPAEVGSTIIKENDVKCILLTIVPSIIE